MLDVGTADDCSSIDLKKRFRGPKVFQDDTRRTGQAMCYDIVWGGLNALNHSILWRNMGGCVKGWVRDNCGGEEWEQINSSWPQVQIDSLGREFATDLLVCTQNQFMHFILLLPSRSPALIKKKTAPLFPRCSPPIHPNRNPELHSTSVIARSQCLPSPTRPQFGITQNFSITELSVRKEILSSTSVCWYFLGSHTEARAIRSGTELKRNLSHFNWPGLNDLYW